MPPLRASRAGLAYADTGGCGPAVVLLHGVGLDHTMWAAQVAALAGAYRVILPDMPGHGASAPLPPGAGLADYAAALEALLAEIEAGPCALVGFSMGALVARAHVLAHGERLRALVLMSGVFGRSEEARAAILARVAEVEAGGPGANAEAAIARWFSPEWRAAHPEALAALRGQLHGNDWAGYLASYRLFATQDNYGAERLAAITVPTLVVTGEHDVGSTPAMALALARAIPEARAQIVPGARHMMPVEHAEATNALLVRQLARTLTPTSALGVLPQ